MRDLLCIKLGGSVITDKKIAYRADTKRIREIAGALKSIRSPLLLSHGSGSYGHTSAKKYGGLKGYSSKIGIAKVFQDALAINKIVMDIFINEGLPVVSFSPRSFLVSESGRLKNSFITSIEEALNQDLIPVVFGDVVLDAKWKTTIFSGEKTLSILCSALGKHYHIKKIIEFCDIDGVLDERKKSIQVINSQNWKTVKKSLFTNSLIDITGGMAHKVETALEAAELGIETFIVNGRKKTQIQKVLNGELVGTRISL